MTTEEEQVQFAEELAELLKKYDARICAESFAERGYVIIIRSGETVLDLGREWK